ncbi:hypothetical protein [Romboutsia sp. 1001285H_161024_C4]|nr:hypothetical protein [Romboutsia sp. 1001285H_161024_C4]
MSEAEEKKDLLEFIQAAEILRKNDILKFERYKGRLEEAVSIYEERKTI